MATEVGLETPLRFVVGDEQKVNATALTSGEEMLKTPPASEKVIHEPKSRKPISCPRRNSALQWDYHIQQGDTTRNGSDKMRDSKPVKSSSFLSMRHDRSESWFGRKVTF